MTAADLVSKIAKMVDKEYSQEANEHVGLRRKAVGMYKWGNVWIAFVPAIIAIPVISTAAFNDHELHVQSCIFFLNVCHRNEDSRVSPSCFWSLLLMQLTGFYHRKGNQ